MLYFFLHSQLSAMVAFLLMCMFWKPHHAIWKHPQSNNTQVLEEGTLFFKLFLTVFRCTLFSLTSQPVASVSFFFFFPNHYLVCCCRQAFFLYLWLQQLQCGVTVLSISFTTQFYFFCSFLFCLTTSVRNIDFFIGENVHKWDWSGSIVRQLLFMTPR